MDALEQGAEVRGMFTTDTRLDIAIDGLGARGTAVDQRLASRLQPHARASGVYLVAPASHEITAFQRRHDT